MSAPSISPDEWAAAGHPLAHRSNCGYSLVELRGTRPTVDFEMPSSIPMSRWDRPWSLRSFTLAALSLHHGQRDQFSIRDPWGNPDPWPPRRNFGMGLQKIIRTDI